MRTAVMSAVLVATSFLTGCCTGWRDVTTDDGKHRMFEPWIAPGERATLQLSTCYMWLANMVGIAALPEMKSRWKASDGRIIDRGAFPSQGGKWDFEAETMLSEEFMVEWRRAVAKHDEWMAEHPASNIEPPRIIVDIAHKLVAFNPQVSVVAPYPQVHYTAPSTGDNVEPLGAPGVRRAALPASDVFWRHPAWGSARFSSATNTIRPAPNESLFWIIDAVPTELLRRIDPSDPETMRVRTNWGWLVASFDDEGALHIDGVAELPDAAVE